MDQLSKLSCSAICNVPGKERKNRFVVVACQYPFSVSCFCLVLAVVFTAVGIVVQQNGGDYLFSEDQGNDQKDIRTIQHDAYMAAQRYYIDNAGLSGQVISQSGQGQGPNGGENRIIVENERPQSVSKHVFWNVYVGDGDNVFTAKSLAAMRALNTAVTTESDYPKYCKLIYSADTAGTVTSKCEAPLNPSYMFYSDVSPSTVDLGLFATSDITLYSTCFLSKISLSAEAFPLLTSCQAIDFANPNVDLVKAQKLLLQTYYWMSGCDVFSGLLNVQELTLGAAASTCTSASLPGVAIACAHPTGAAVGNTFNYVVTADRSSGSYRAVRIEGMPAGSDLATKHTACKAAGGTKVGGWGKGAVLQDISATLLVAANMKTISSFKPLVDLYFDKSFSVSNPKSKYSRSFDYLGFPLGQSAYQIANGVAPYKNSEDRGSDQDKELGKWFQREFRSLFKNAGKGTDMEVLYFCTPVLAEEFQFIIIRDLSLASASCVFVFLWIWGQTGSLFIAIAGMFEIIFALPLAFMVYRVIFGFRFFAGLNALCLFVIMAIGADDIFVFMDAWKQSAYQGPAVLKDLETRLTWVYERAGYAMLITSLTTMCAFAAAASSPLAEVQSFGIFAALVIGCDYLMIVTWFTACVVIYHNFIETKANVCCLPCCVPNVCCIQRETAPSSSPPTSSDSFDSTGAFLAASVASPAQQMMVTVPDGHAAGDQMCVQGPEGQTLEVAVPENMGAGSTFTMTFPATGATGATGAGAGAEAQRLCCPSIQTKCPTFINVVTTACVSLVGLFVINWQAKFNSEDVGGCLVLITGLCILIAVLYKDPVFEGVFVNCNAVWALKGYETSTEKAKLLYAKGHKPQKRVVERFFDERFGAWLADTRFRAGIIAVFVALFVFFCVFAVRVRPATKENQAFDKDHPFQRIFTISSEQFPHATRDEPSIISVVWGIDTIDKSGVNQLIDPSKKGTLKWDEGFSFSVEVQQHIVDTCKSLRTRTSEKADGLVRPDDRQEGLGKVSCFTDDFVKWCAAPVPPATTGARYPFPVPLAQAETALGQWLESKTFDRNFMQVTQREKWQNGVVNGRGGPAIGFVGGKLKYASIIGESPMDFYAQQSYTELKREYDRWEAWLKTVNAGRPAGTKPVIQLNHGGRNPKWVWMRNQQVFVSSAILGAIAGLTLAFAVILLATRSPSLAIFAALTIASIIICVIGTMELLGWELGPIESICITILAGFSVDYVVHLAHAYTHSKAATRVARMQSALSDMGISVLSGMATSVLASVPLFFCIIVFFAKFGSFLCMTVVFSWVWANFFFMGLTAQCGPEISKASSRDAIDAGAGTASESAVELWDIEDNLARQPNSTV